MSSVDSSSSNSIDIGLELRGGGTASGSSSPPQDGISAISVQKIAPSPRCIQLIVDLQGGGGGGGGGTGPCVVMDAEQANHVAALLLDELDRLEGPACLYRVTVSKLKFTQQGAAGLSAFLTSYASTIKAVAFNGVLKPPMPNEKDYDYAADCNNIIQLASAFASSALDVLNLSDNVLRGAAIWRPWRGQQLQQLLLDKVEMDSSSWQALNTTVSWESLEDLHIVVDQAMHLPRDEPLIPTDGSVSIRGPSQKTQAAMHHIIRSCTKLNSLRWVIFRKEAASSAAWLPLQGLREMARRMFQQSLHGGSLRHLVIEGGLADNLAGSLRSSTRQEDAPPPFLTQQACDDLCTALTDLPRLRTLKLRHVGLTDLPPIVASLRNSRPPLECLDFSHNLLTGNVRSVCELASVHKTIKDMNALVLSYNRIDTDTGRELLETFAANPKVSSSSSSPAASASSTSSVASADPRRTDRAAARRGSSSISGGSDHGSISAGTTGGGSWNSTFDLRLDNNPHLRMNKIAFSLAKAKYVAEKECMELRKQEDKLLSQAMNTEEHLQQQITQSNSATAAAQQQASDANAAALIQDLEQENKRLMQERDTLMKAFSIMGLGQQVDEQKRLLERLSRLEDLVVLGAVFKSGNGSNTSSERRGGGGDSSSKREQLSSSKSRRKILVSDLPYQLERFRGVQSSRSIGSSTDAGNMLLGSSSNHSRRSPRRSSVDCADGLPKSISSSNDRRRSSVGATGPSHHSNRSNRSHSNRSHSTASLTDPEPMSPHASTTPPSLLPASSCSSASSSTRSIGRRSPAPPPPPPPPPPSGSLSSAPSPSSSRPSTPQSPGDRWESLVYHQQQQQNNHHQQQQVKHLAQLHRTSSSRRVMSNGGSHSHSSAAGAHSNHALRGSRTMDGLVEGVMEDSP